MSITAKDIEIEHDIIIGRPTLVNNNLLKAMSYLLVSPEVVGERADFAGRHEPNPNADTTTAAAPRHKMILNITDDEPGFDKAIYPDYISEDNRSLEEGDGLPSIDTDDSEFATELREICIQYRDIFSKSIRTEPALVPPLDIKVDDTNWTHNRKNSRPPRSQTLHKEQELRRHVEKLLNLNAIRPSTATAQSQVLLVPKQGTDELRPCIDYRELNKISDSDNWPIPRVNVMLRRLGAQKAQYYGKFDFTSGYHQTPIRESCKIFTAFITLMGIYV